MFDLYFHYLWITGFLLSSLKAEEAPTSGYHGISYEDN